MSAAIPTTGPTTGPAVADRLPPAPAGVDPGRPALARSRALLAGRPELAVAVALVTVLLATSGRYGWFNDELYFVRAGAEPAWGYPDQPALNPIALHALFDLGGGRLEVVRAVAALAMGATVVLAGSMAGRTGAGRAGRLVAAGLWAGTGAALVNGHAFVTGTLDVLATAVVCWALVRAATGGSPRWLAVAGLALGIGLTNKMLVGAVAACLVLGLLAVGPRGPLRSWWAVAGAAAAGLGAAPYLVWQARHGWPQAGVADSISAMAENRVPGQLLAQATMLSVPALPLFVGGLVLLFRSRRLRAVRFVGVGYGSMLLLVLVLDGRGYYTCGFGPALAALGGVAGERWLHAARPARRAGRAPGRRPVALAGLLAGAFAVNAAFCLPLVPVERLQASGVGGLNPMIIDEVGWPEVARTVADVYRRVPPADRARTVVFTTNYAIAGAVDVHGPALGLPRAYSGHNGYAGWGPPPVDDGPVVLVGFDGPAAVADAFEGCRRVATTDNGVGLVNSTGGLPVLLCAGPVRPWAQLWPRLVHFDLGLSRTLPDPPDAAG